MLKIDFGSGYHPKRNYKTLDFNYGCDYYSLDELDDNSVDEFRLRNVIHHIYDLNGLFEKIYKKLKPDGVLNIIDCRKEYFKNNVLLDKIWYRYIFNRNDIYISNEYIDPDNILLKLGFTKIKELYKKEKFIKKYRK